MFSIVVAITYGEEKYTTKYDNIDLDEILNSERLLKNYFECVMDRGRCTPDGLELKSKSFNITRKSQIFLECQLFICCPQF